MKYYHILLLAGLSLIIASCCCWDENCISGEGPVLTEKRNVSGFSEIHILNDADVYISQGDRFEVIAEAQESVLEELELDVSHDALYIEYDHCIRHHDGLKLFITVKELNEIYISGSGKVINETPIISDYLTLKITGSGDIHLSRLDVPDIKSTISGSGGIELSGDYTAERHDITISGSGNIWTYDFPVKEVDISIPGSGNCRVNAIDKLDVSISGSGSVYYIGQPEIKKYISGSGSIIEHN